MPLREDLKWLPSGWWACARHPEVIKLQTAKWFNIYVTRAFHAAEILGWTEELRGPDGGKILAALARAANSGKNASHIKTHKNNDGAINTLERFYISNEGYDKSDRWENVSSWTHFKGVAPTQGEDLTRGLDYSVQPVDTTVVR